MNDQKTIYDLGLHEILGTEKHWITRVPGGWLYKFFHHDSLVFVPYNEEFKEKEDIDLVIEKLAD